MDPITGALVGAGVGFLKNKIFDAPAAKRRNLAQAEITKYSPWTGMKGELEAAPSAFGSMAQGAMTGAMMGKSKVPTPSGPNLPKITPPAGPDMVAGASGIPMGQDAIGPMIAAPQAQPDLLSQAGLLPEGMDKMPYSKWDNGNMVSMSPQQFMGQSAPAAIPQGPSMIAGSAGIPMQAPAQMPTQQKPPMLASNQQFNPWQGMM